MARLQVRPLMMGYAFICYWNDTVLFCDANTKQLLHIRMVLACFEVAVSMSEYV